MELCYAAMHIHFASIRKKTKFFKHLRRTICTQFISISRCLQVMICKQFNSSNASSDNWNLVIFTKMYLRATFGLSLSLFYYAQSRSLSRVHRTNSFVEFKNKNLNASLNKNSRNISSCSEWRFSFRFLFMIFYELNGFMIWDSLVQIDHVN